MASTKIDSDKQSLRRFLFLENVFPSTLPTLYVCEAEIVLHNLNIKNDIFITGRTSSIKTLKLLGIVRDILLTRSWIREHCDLEDLERRIMEEVNDNLFSIPEDALLSHQFIVWIF